MKYPAMNILHNQSYLTKAAPFVFTAYIKQIYCLKVVNAIKVLKETILCRRDYSCWYLSPKKYRPFCMKICTWGKGKIV